ncbi:MAG: DUF3071 domain-containing protein [Actinobacteria bacterium]|nr:DUF3071 domain-containing protein [Actinomycetota bacterium]
MADGGAIELTDASGAKYSLPITEALKSTVTQPRLTSVAPVDERPSFSVKEIQARLRGGESMPSISRTTDWSIEKIEKFAGPILQERAYVIETALKSNLRREATSPTLAEASLEQLAGHGVDMEQVEWNTHRNGDGTWNIVVHYPNIDGTAEANWNFELGNRILIAQDDSARWISGDAKEARPRTASHGFINSQEPTPFAPSTPPPPAPRLVAVREEVTVTEIVTEDEEFFAEELDIEIVDESDPVSDGVIKRPKLPSWDDIMFGGSKSEDE